MQVIALSLEATSGLEVISIRFLVLLGCVIALSLEAASRLEAIAIGFLVLLGCRSLLLFWRPLVGWRPSLLGSFCLEVFRVAPRQGGSPLVVFAGKEPSLWETRLETPDRLLLVRHLFLRFLVTTSKALVTTSKALVPSSFLLLLVRHLLLLAMHLLLEAYCY